MSIRLNTLSKLLLQNRVVEKFRSVDQQNILQSVVSIKQRIHFLITPIYYIVTQ